MDHFDYIRTHEISGLNDTILAAHPGGAIVEIGGGLKKRFRGSMHPVINVEKQDGAYGDVVLERDADFLDNGFGDKELREATEAHGGIGTIIMSHVLQEVRAATCRTLLETAMPALRENGSLWVVMLDHDRSSRALATMGGGMGQMAEWAKQKKEVEGSIGDLRRTHSSRIAVLSQFNRVDFLTDMQAVLPKNVERKLWEATERGQVTFAGEEGWKNMSATERYEKLDAATMRQFVMQQRVLQCGEGGAGAWQSWMSQQQERLSAFLEKNRDWLKRKRKAQKK